MSFIAYKYMSYIINNQPFSCASSVSLCDGAPASISSVNSCILLPLSSVVNVSVPTLHTCPRVLGIFGFACWLMFCPWYSLTSFSYEVSSCSLSAF